MLNLFRFNGVRFASSLKIRVMRAGIWAVAGHLSSLIVRLIGTVVLSRIFAPDVFGVLSVVTTFFVVLSLFTDVGLRQIVISSPNGGNPSFLHTAWTVQIIRGFIVWMLCVVAAGVTYIFARFQFVSAQSVYSSDEFPLYVVVASLCTIIFGFQSMKSATASREMNLKRLTQIELVSQLVSLSVVGIAGWLTRSIWAYIFGGLIYWLVLVLLGHIFLPGEDDKFGWDRTALDELSKFGRWVVVSSTLGTLAANSDKLLLGGWISPAMLGCYSIAASLIMVPEAISNRIFSSVALPALSELKRGPAERYVQTYRRMRLLTSASLVFISGGIFSTADLIVDVLYDPRYEAAGPMLRWLSLGLIFFSQFGLAQNFYLSLGKPSYVTVLNVLRLLSLGVLVPLLFYFFGLYGAILGVAFHLMPAAVFSLWLDYRNKLLGTGAMVAILAWPAGWFAGLVAVQLFTALKSFF